MTKFEKVSINTSCGYLWPLYADKFYIATTLNRVLSGFIWTGNMPQSYIDQTHSTILAEKCYTLLNFLMLFGLIHTF